VCAGWIDGEWRRAPTGAEPLDEVSTVLLHSKLEGGEGGPGTGAACLPLPFTCRLQEFRADSAFLERGRVGCETCPPSFRGPRSGATLSSEVAGRKGMGRGTATATGSSLASAGAPVVAPGVRLRVPSFADPSPSFCILRQGENFPAPSSSLLSSSVPANRVLTFVHSWALKASSAPGRGSGALGACPPVLLFVSFRAGAQRRRHTRSRRWRARSSTCGCWRRGRWSRCMMRMSRRVCVRFGGSGRSQTAARAILNVRVLAPRTVEPIHDADVSTRAIRVCVRFGGSGRSLQGAD
jgi:hypothetical protein